MNRNQKRTKELLNPNESYKKADAVNLRGLTNNELNNLTFHIARVSAITGIIPEALSREPKQLFWKHPELLLVIRWDDPAKMALTTHKATALGPLSERAQDILAQVMTEAFLEALPGTPAVH